MTIHRRMTLLVSSLRLQSTARCYSLLSMYFQDALGCGVASRKSAATRAGSKTTENLCTGRRCRRIACEPLRMLRLLELRLCGVVRRRGHSSPS